MMKKLPAMEMETPSFAHFHVKADCENETVQWFLCGPYDVDVCDLSAPVWAKEQLR